MDARSPAELEGGLTAEENAQGRMAGARRVLFVCMGNICRSPAAEGVFRQFVLDREVDGAIEIDSAGTISYHQGEPPDARMRQAAARRGYQLDGASRPVVEEDFRHFDLIVAMDRDNLGDLEDRAGGAQSSLRLFSDFLPAGSPSDIPDPYYGGPHGFERVLDMVEDGCPSLLEELLTAVRDGAG